MNVAPNHPAYTGHFPGRPILPAVVVLTEVLATIEAQTGRSLQHWMIVTAKFLVAVTPGEPLTLAHADTASGGIRFEVQSPHGIVAWGTLAPRRAA